MLFPGVLTRVCVAWQIGVHLTIQTASLPKSLESTPLSCGLQLFVRDTARVRVTAYPIAEVLHIQLLSWRLVCCIQTRAGPSTCVCVVGEMGVVVPTVVGVGHFRLDRVVLHRLAPVGQVRALKSSHSNYRPAQHARPSKVVDHRSGSGLYSVSYITHPTHVPLHSRIECTQCARRHQ